VKRALPALALFLLALLPRLAALGLYVTPDEPAWVLRSVHFRAALLAGRPADTLQSGHPGATTMWLGALGISVQAALDPAGTQPAIDTLAALPRLDPADDAPYRAAGKLLSSARIAVALANALGLVALYVLARRRPPEGVALLAAVLLALDPFAAGLGGLLHVDALAATWMALSAVLAWNALSNSPPHPFTPSPLHLFTLSGAFAALAALTKTPAAYGALFVVGLIAVQAWREHWARAQVVRALGLFALGGALTALLVFPAVWAAPLNTLATLTGAAGKHQEGGLRQSQFLGKITSNPGPAFYPVALALRATPALLLGILGGLWLAVQRRDRVALGALAYSLGFVALLTVASTKFDRYALPALPGLALLAALGWHALVERFPRWRSAALALVALTPALVLAESHPYYLTGYNPVLGGRATAAWALAPGWGEDAGAAARRLDASQDSATLWVATTQVPSFAPLFSGRTVWLDAQRWPQAGVLVLTESDRQNDPHGYQSWSALGDVQPLDAPLGAWLITPAAPRAQLAYLQEHARAGDVLVFDAPAWVARTYAGPAQVVVLSGTLDPQALAGEVAPARGSARAFHVPQPGVPPALRALVAATLARAANTPPESGPEGIALYALAPGAALEPPPPAARFESAAELIAASFSPVQAQFPESVFLYAAWRPLDGGSYEGVATLVDEDGEEWVSVKTPLDGAHVAQAEYGLALPPGIPPGTYHARVQIIRPENGQSLGAWDAHDRFLGSRVELTGTLVEVVAPRFGPDPARIPLAAHIGRAFPSGLVLQGTDFTGAAVFSGDHTRFDLLWSNGGTGALAPACDTLDWRLAVAGAPPAAPFGDADRMRAPGQAGTLPLSRYAPERWQPGEALHARYVVDLDPDLPAGRYTLAVAPGCDPGAWQDVAALDVTPRARAFALPPIGHALSVPFGALAVLRGYDVAQSEVHAGEVVSLTLYWQASGRTRTDYSVFVHVTGPAGLVAQSDRDPQDGDAPTSSWVAGQVIVDPYALRLKDDLAPGAYTITVGLYSPLNGEYVLANGRDNQIILDTQLYVTK
jgi:4-amino-4-deoxy-L-arabinose transferase-like glycosyltransferase